MRTLIASAAFALCVTPAFAGEDIMAGSYGNTIVSTGGDDNVGASKLTGEVTKIASQVPALFEALSGMNLKDLMGNVKAMKPREERAATTRNKLGAPFKPFLGLSGTAM